MPLPELHSLLPELRFTATRSRGPGGQNVNKVSSAAVLTWDFETSRCLDDAEKRRVRTSLAARLNQSGMLSLRSDRYRDLPRNKEACVEKLMALLEKALFVPKRRKKTKVTHAAKQKRLTAKRRRGQVKQLRRSSSED